MTKYYYAKGQKKNRKKIIRLLGLGMSVLGLCLVFYIFAPYVMYQLNFAGVFAEQNITAPIPRTTLITSGNTRGYILPEDNNNFSDDDYLNAQNWFPTYSHIRARPKVPYYSVNIPRLGITNAAVSTVDDNLAMHLVNFAGTAVPPDHGTALVFGHSTIPSLYDPKNYKTIFANIYKMSVGDDFIVTVENKTYTYEIYAMTVINPDDTSVFAQSYDDSYLYVITCVPPGTVEKRLVLKSRLKNQS